MLLLKALAAYYKEVENNIVIAYLSDKLVYELLDEDLGIKAIQVNEDLGIKAIQVAE